jgi:hypothetical protein
VYNVLNKKATTINLLSIGGWGRRNNEYLEQRKVTVKIKEGKEEGKEY